MKGKAHIDYSVVISVYNEEANIFPLHDKLKHALRRIGEYEIILVDDGNTNQTFDKLVELHESDDRLRVVKLRRNFGQSTALAAGFDRAAGEVVRTRKLGLVWVREPTIRVHSIMTRVQSQVK